MNTILRFLAAAMVSGLMTSAQALVIESIALEDIYFEFLPDEILQNGGTTVTVRSVTDIDGVTNPSPTFTASEDETDEELRTRERSTIARASYRVLINDIEAGDSPVYTLDRGTGAVSFGDGLKGARLPSGDTGVASYDYGGGAEGNILQSFIVDLNDFSPFLIPDISFPKDEQGDTDYSFVISGIQSLDLVFSDYGMLIANVESNSIPEPSILLLLIAGLAALAGIGGVKKI
ncbi:MAG: PEP-CTERM sorting domain-containing protein [Gammaproteobacteria bacterium]|nr:PEP-CTERM sorting domain-containing protein [Gammaproteobacteria bacterium]